MSASDPTERERIEANHVCAFCRTSFDAGDRSACPECGAEVVLRGERG